MYRYIPLPEDPHQDVPEPPSNWRDNSVLSVVCWLVIIVSLFVNVWLTIGFVLLLSVTRTLGPICGRKYADQQAKRAHRKARQQQWERQNRGR